MVPKHGPREKKPRRTVEAFLRKILENGKGDGGLQNRFRKRVDDGGGGEIVKKKTLTRAGNARRENDTMVEKKKKTTVIEADPIGEKPRGSRWGDYGIKWRCKNDGNVLRLRASAREREAEKNIFYTSRPGGLDGRKPKRKTEEKDVFFF